MTTTQVSIGQVKRDISELVNRVAFGQERIILTSRGKPKAAIVSINDLEKLNAVQQKSQQEAWQLWVAENQQLNSGILARRAGEPIDLELIWNAGRLDLEERDGG